MKKMLQRVSRIFVGDMWEETPTVSTPTIQTTTTEQELPTAKTIHKTMNRIRKEAAK